MAEQDEIVRLQVQSEGYIYSNGRIPMELADGLVYRDFDVMPDGSVFGEVRVLEDLLLLAATELAKSFGAHVGEGLATGFINAILGKSSGQAEFEAEVIARLARIEGKLDNLIKYLKSEFPEVVQKIVDAGHAEATRKQLSSAAVEVDGELANFKRAASHETATALRAAAINTAKLGHQLLQYGPGSFSAGIHAAVTFLSAMTELVRYDPKRFRQDVAHWSKEYLRLTTAFMDSAIPGSLTFARARAQERLTHAQTVQASIGTTATILNVVYGPQVKYTPTEDVYQCYPTTLHSWNHSVWQGTQPRVPQLIPTATTLTPQEWASKLNAKVVAWWPTQLNPRRHPHDIFLELLQHANSQCVVAEQLPAALSRLDNEISSCEHLIEALEAMTQLA